MNSAADSPAAATAAAATAAAAAAAIPSVREDSDDDDDNDEWPATPQTAASALAVRPTPPPPPAVKVRLRSERTEENSSSSSPLSGGGRRRGERDSNELRLVSARPLGRCALLRLNRGTGGDLPPSHEISLALLSFLFAGMMSKVRKLAPACSGDPSSCRPQIVPRFLLPLFRVGNPSWRHTAAAAASVDT